jgi:hypothetical protein
MGYVIAAIAGEVLGGIVVLGIFALWVKKFF